MTDTTSIGKRGRVITVAQQESQAGKKQEDYTPEYHESKTYLAYVQNIYASYESDQLTESDQQSLIEAADCVEAEREISEIARRYGYQPGLMDKKQWAELSDKLVNDAKEELQHASQSDRDAVGDKLRGKKDTWRQVGGQAILTRSGMSKKDAKDVVRNLNARTKDAAEEHLGQKLTEYGYDEQMVEDLSYNQKRKLMSEIGHGVRHPSKMKGVSNEKREQIINQASERKQRAAREMSLVPKAAKGLDMWGAGLQAAEKAEYWEQEIPPDYIYEEERDKAPKYVLYPKGDENYKEPKSNDDEFVF